MKWLRGSAGLCVCRPRPACYFLEVIRPTLPHQGKALMISGSHEICTARRSLASRSLDSTPSSPPFTPLRCPFSPPHQLFPRLFSLQNCFPRPFPWNQLPISVICRRSRCLCPHSLYPSTFVGQFLPDIFFDLFVSDFLSLKSKPMKIMSPKWSEHFEFNMCENIWIQRREHSAVLSFPGKCCRSRWDQTSTPPHLSAHPAPSVPLVSHEHRNYF